MSGRFDCDVTSTNYDELVHLSTAFRYVSVIHDQFWWQPHFHLPYSGERSRSILLTRDF